MHARHHPTARPVGSKFHQDPTIAPLVSAFVKNRPAQTSPGQAKEPDDAGRRMNIVLIRAAAGF